MKTTLLIFLFSFLSIFANAAVSNLTVKELLAKTKVTDLPKLAVDFSTNASKFHAKGDFKNALLNYKKSIEIRKAIGLENSAGNANTLHLKSIVEHKLEDSCSAVSSIKEAIQVYKFLSMTKEAMEAEKENLREFRKLCNTAKLTQN